MLGVFPTLVIICNAQPAFIIIRNVDFLKKATELPAGRDLEENSNQLQCKMGAIGEGGGVF